LAALFNCASDECDEEIVRVANEVRKEHGTVPADEIDRIFSEYYRKVFTSSAASTRFLNAVPPAEHVGTFRWLFDGRDYDESKGLLRTCYLAVLQEAAGQREEALANYREIRAKVPKNSGALSDTADAGLKRLSTKR